MSRQQIVALDSSSGTETWRAAANFEQPPILVADKTRALSVEQRKLVARDSITGAVLPTRPTEASATDVILRDSVAYVIGKSRTGYALVRAEDLERGVSLWQRQFATGYLVPLGADRDAIYLSGGSTLEILALDRSNGQPRYSRVFRDGRFATLVTGSSSAVLIARDHRLAALRRVEMPRAPETCRVKGRFRIETEGVKLPKTHPVRVADQIIWTDAQGRFEAEVRVHGDLLVEATLSNVRLTPEDCVRSEPVLLVPDRRTDAYDVELLIRAKTDCLDR